MICFSGLKIKRLRDFIHLVSPTALAVFVIHVHTIVWNHIFYAWPSRHGLWKAASVPKLCANIIGWALMTFLICILLDLIREGLFSLLQVKRLLKKADEVSSRILSKTSGG